MNTLIIPIDFKVASLLTLRYALEQETEFPVRVILLHSTFLDDSISKLLFYSPSKLISNRMSNEFSEGIEILKNHFEGKIHSLHIRLLHSNNLSYFQNFTDQNLVSKIYIPKSYKLKTEGRDFNPIALFRKSGLPLIELQWENSQAGENEQLNLLFK
jgi:hypothetical protein